MFSRLLYNKDIPINEPQRFLVIVLPSSKTHLKQIDNAAFCRWQKAALSIVEPPEPMSRSHFVGRDLFLLAALYKFCFARRCGHEVVCRVFK